MHIYVLLLLLVGLGWSTVPNLNAQKISAPRPAKKAGTVPKPKLDEAAIRADEAKKVAGFPTGLESLEAGKFYHALSSRGVVTQTNQVCYVLLQEVRGVPSGPIVIWQVIGPPPRFYKFNVYLDKDSVYEFKTGTNGLMVKKVGILPDMRMLPILPFPAPGQAPGPLLVPPPPSGRPGTKA